MRFDQHQSDANGRPEPAKKRFWSGLATVAAGLMPIWGGSAIAQGPPPAPVDVVLNSNSFQIPFNISAAGAIPAEVRLFVAAAGEPAEGQSGVSGRMATAALSRDVPAVIAPNDWQLLDRQPPGAGQFKLQDLPDGVFWFATQTIDSRGKPANSVIRPELRVTIDTVDPEVTMRADADFDGTVTAEFEIRDASTTDNLTVHYVTDETRQWEIAQVQRAGNRGRFEIRGGDRWQQMSVRLRVVDAAENETIVSKLLKKPRLASKPETRLASGPPSLPSQGSFDFGRLFAGPFQNQGPSLPPPASPQQISEDFGMSPMSPTMPLTSEQIVAPEPDRDTAEAVLPSPRTPAEALRPISGAPSGDGSTGRESDPATEMVLPGIPERIQPENAAQMSAPEIIPPGVVRPQTPFALVPPELGDSSSTPETATVPESNAWKPMSSLPNQGRGSTNGPSDSLTPELRSMAGGPSPLERRNRPPQRDLTQLAAMSPIRHSDSNRFSLDYEIESIGGRGVSQVELFGSLDGGQTWKQWGDDPDQKTPFDIETNGEGTFGFCIVVVAANGLASPRPQPGDAPDIVVVVDQTRPTVEITGAKYGEGDRTGSLVIAYDCADDYLTARPVTLAFSDSVEGPWTTIAAGLRNLGDYVWPADSQLPRQIFLRIDATDQSGNVGTFVLDQPIDTRGLAPRARIRAFRPIATRAPAAGQ